MNSRSKLVFGVVVALGEAYRQRVSEVTANAYTSGLEGLSDEDVLRASKLALQRCKFFPSPVELRELAGEASQDQLAVHAWQDVQRAIPHGSWKHIDFQDVVINATVRAMGGWPQFVGRFSDAENEKWARIEFLKLYKSMVGTLLSPESSAPLAGLSEATSVNGELVDPIPVRIGCRDRQRLAMSPSRPVVTEAISFHAAVRLKKP